MDIVERLQADMKQAMKNKDKFRLSVIRMIRSEIQNLEISKSGPVSEDDVIELLSKEKKKRAESLKEYQEAGRDDIVEDLKNEISILEEYLPAQLSDEELRAIIQDAVHKVGATSPKDMGKVMQEVMPQVKGRADGKQVNRFVSELLN